MLRLKAWNWNGCLNIVVLDNLLVNNCDVLTILMTVELFTACWISSCKIPKLELEAIVRNRANNVMGTTKVQWNLIQHQVRVITVFTVFRLLTDFVCLYTYEFWLSLCKIVRSSVILLLPLFWHPVQSDTFPWSLGVLD
jgi:hypothetical protein